MYLYYEFLMDVFENIGPEDFTLIIAAGYDEDGIK
jgi:hypothetical protein